MFTEKAVLAKAKLSGMVREGQSVSDRWTEYAKYKRTKNMVHMGNKKEIE
jgi:hypothetical protein